MAQPIPQSSLLHSFRRHLEAKNRSERTLASYLQSLAQMLERRGNQAGLPGLHPHRLWHTFAHQWLAEGVARRT